MIKSLILGGGCFWCVEHDLKEAIGVMSVISGYSGGDTTTPTYENHKGHREVVLVEYVDEGGRGDAEDSSPNVKGGVTSYKKLLQFFIDHIDPIDDGGQFADRGESYKTAIFYESEEEKRIAENVIQELDYSKVYDKPAVIEILPRKEFYKAEEYHQNYAENNPTHYNAYRVGSGRDSFVNRTCQIREEKKINWKE
ncbi:MAG: methionine sulfoxide reductase [Candidatus Nomurabacteria bacterium]|nr:methionine sulfoxide reductase [Candidatus Nomurabacteria bacterium]